ncbi:hypothetical protein [Tomitella biformata]|uniref:hypothetical protein n=1 Tax=Tomitella biformata TaxID=630403 RepID=UPI0004650F77|nr:hypothetical protein [Tomitella biformata]
MRLPDGTVKVLVDNLDPAFRGDASVVIDGDRHDGATQSARVQRLDGGALDANSDTTFGGATVSSEGTFTPKAPLRLKAGPNGYALPIDSPSAAVLTVG